jgi:uncharacterized protein YndB with AHSA1/START domain
MPLPQRIDVKVTHWFDASTERVFDAWLDPELIGKWMFGPAVRNEEVLRIERADRVGGSFSFAVYRGGEVIDHVGRYLEIDRPRRLAFTWAIGREAADGTDATVCIDLRRLENGTTDLTLVHQMPPEWAAHAERVEAAWQHMLDVLDQTLSEFVE